MMRRINKRSSALNSGFKIKVVKTARGLSISSDAPVLLQRLAKQSRDFKEFIRGLKLTPCGYKLSSANSGSLILVPVTDQVLSKSASDWKHAVERRIVQGAVGEEGVPAIDEEEVAKFDSEESGKNIAEVPADDEEFTEPKKESFWKRWFSKRKKSQEHQEEGSPAEYNKKMENVMLYEQIGKDSPKVPADDLLFTNPRKAKRRDFMRQRINRRGLVSRRIGRDRFRKDNATLYGIEPPAQVVSADDLNYWVEAVNQYVEGGGDPYSPDLSRIMGIMSGLKGVYDKWAFPRGYEPTQEMIDSNSVDVWEVALEEAILRFGGAGGLPISPTPAEYGAIVRIYKQIMSGSYDFEDTSGYDRYEFANRGSRVGRTSRFRHVPRRRISRRVQGRRSLNSMPRQKISRIPKRTLENTNIRRVSRNIPRSIKERRVSRNIPRARKIRGVRIR